MRIASRSREAGPLWSFGALGEPTPPGRPPHRRDRRRIVSREAAKPQRIRATPGAARNRRRSQSVAAWGALRARRRHDAFAASRLRVNQPSLTSPGGSESDAAVAIACGAAAGSGPFVPSRSLCEPKKQPLRPRRLRKALAGLAHRKRA
jgi:hypothetical protein